MASCQVSQWRGLDCGERKPEARMIVAMPRVAWTFVCLAQSRGWSSGFLGYGPQNQSHEIHAAKPSFIGFCSRDVGPSASVAGGLVEMRG